MKKILSLLVIIFCIFLISCNKSEKEEIKLKNNPKYEETISSKNSSKYEAYYDLYLILDYNNPFYIFDEKYMEEIFDENGKVKNFKKEGIEKLGDRIRNKFNNLSPALNKIKLYVDEEPRYTFDKEIENMVNVSILLKEEMLSIIEYYKKSLYEKDNHKKGKKFYKEYKKLLNEVAVYQEEFLHRMRVITEIEKSAGIYKLLKESNAISKIELLEFINNHNEILSLIFFKSRLNFSFSQDNIKELKQINESISQQIKKLQSISDKQLEIEGINSSEFGIVLIPRINDFLDISQDIVTLLEKEEAIEKRVEALYETYEKIDKSLKEIF